MHKSEKKCKSRDTAETNLSHLKQLCLGGPIFNIGFSLGLFRSLFCVRNYLLQVKAFALDYFYIT